MIRLGGIIVFPMRLCDGTDWLLFVNAKTEMGICEVVLGKYVFRKKREVAEK